MSEVKRFKRHKVTTEQSFSRLGGKLLKAYEEIDRLEAELAEDQGRIIELGTLATDRSRIIAALETQHTQDQARIRELEEWLSKMAAEITLGEQRIDDFDADNENLVWVNTSLRRDKEHLQSELAKYKLKYTSEVLAESEAEIARLDWVVDEFRKASKSKALDLLNKLISDSKNPTHFRITCERLILERRQRNAEIEELRDDKICKECGTLGCEFHFQLAEDQ